MNKTSRFHCILLKKSITKFGWPWKWTYNRNKNKNAA